MRHAKAADVAKSTHNNSPMIPSKEPWSGWDRGREQGDAQCLSLGCAIISASTRSKDATRWTSSGCCCYCCRKEKETLSAEDEEDELPENIYWFFQLNVRGSGR